MATERIPCGGFFVDTSTLQFQDKVLKAVGGITGAYLPLTGGTMQGAINMGNNKITNVAVPIDNGDAANKQYVDNKVPALATVTTAGVVKEIPNIEQFTNPSSATAQEIADKFNNLIQNLINAGIMVAGN